MGGVRLLAWWAPVAAEEGVDWEAVYREELPRVYNFHRYRVGDRATAEDLTSLTFEKAWRARGRYRRGRARVSTWLLSIARNVAIDHFRRQGRRPEVPLEERAVRGGDTPEEEALRRDDERRLASLLADLPPRERELLALKYGAGATNRAIATLTGLSESNVGTILHRTVAALRAAWDEGGRP
jgi:RNA polymerase sigma-70 factor (ECF subfamily)